MQVCLNLLFLVPGETGGTETYVRGLVPALAEQLGAESLTLIVASELAEELARAPWYPGLRFERIPVSGRTRILRALAEQTLVPLRARRAHADVLHNLQSTAPAFSGARASVTTILDVHHLHHPETYSPLRRRGIALLVPLAARRSDRLIAISHATKSDVVGGLWIDHGKVDVVHLGPGLARSVVAASEDDVRRRFDLGSAPIVLSPSARRPHKNLRRLIEAFARVDHAPAPVLVLPGYATGAEDELEALARDLGLDARVRFAGWVTDTELVGLYKAATALVFPSLAEGFGLPVLEAMELGLPVACSNRSSLPEIIGEAGLLFDPEDIGAIADAMRRLLSDTELRRALADAGRLRARQFSWERAARETCEAYRLALEPGLPG